MSLKPTVRVLCVAILLAWAVPASASDIGHEVADQVSLTNYQHYLDDLLYTHDGNNRDAKTGVDKGPARDNIVATFESFGLEVELEPFTYSGTTCYNVVATQLGTVHPDAYYVIGAHYDSVGNPGADDNASGVAGVLEIARILSAYESEYTIKYMAFDAEEYGLIGSDYYVDNHYYDDIRGMISMDMIAWNTGSNRAEMHGFSSCAAIKSALSTAIVEYGQGLTAELFTESYSSSDHGPFQSAGFQACVLIEDNPEDNPCYHTSCDSVDNAGYINYVFATKMIRSAAGYLTDNGHVFRPINCLTGAGCELGTNGDEDCNANGIWDHCDIRCGTSEDVNLNGIPDECEPHETWYVNCANCPGPGTGSEADPFCTIQAAINAAANGMNAVVEIIVADGTYTGTGNKDLDFGGKLLTLRSQNGPATCVIDCQGSGRGFYFHNGETAGAVVDGFTIRNGNVGSSSPGGANGGGVYCSASRPTLTNCVISGNKADGSPRYGGGVYCSYSSPALTGCTISSNMPAGIYATDNSGPMLSTCAIRGNIGSGVYCALNSDAMLDACVISGNSGGGVYCYSHCRATLTRSTVSNNTASGVDSGGGLYAGSSCSLALTGCTVSSNVATGSSSCGGVYSRSTTILTDCMICDNRATGGSGYGGAYFLSTGTMTNCTIIRNTANDGACGGVYSDSNSRLTVTNCMVLENTVIGSAGSEAGGVYCGGQNATLTNCVVAANRSSSGAGVYSPSSAGPRITNCVLWADKPRELALASGTAAVTYCDVQGGYAGTGNINVNPGFAFCDDLHLMPGSPCIDAGTNSPPEGLPQEDAGGRPRSQDGNGDGQAVADMGLYEFDPTGPTIALSPPTLELFAYAEGPNPEPQRFSIRNSGNGAFAWQITEDCSWLSVAPAAGITHDLIDSLTVSVDTAGLTAGEYTCEPIVLVSGATNTPRTVQILLHLGGARRVPADYSTIQAALDAAASNDWVLVADGVWTGTGNKDLNCRGKAIHVSSLNGAAACMIDCQSSGRGFLFSGGETGKTVVEGFTIKNGRVTLGGGICCSSCSSPTVKNCVIHGNTASGSTAFGGGVYCYRSSPTLVNCSISDNVTNGSTYGHGGGVYCSSYAEPTFTGCAISNNIASGSSFAHGGGVYCAEYSGPTLTGCLVKQNAASFCGGGVFSYAPALVMTNCFIIGNRTLGSWGAGGGVRCEGSSTPILTNCIISLNEATGISGYGGGLSCSTANPQLTNCLLWADAPNEIYVSSGSTPVVTYSDIQGGWTGTGNLNTDPFFVDAANGDFHLASNSPCIDAGDPASDYSLEPEPDGGRVNMGAYGNTAEAESKGWLYILGYQMVEKTRVGRTVWDYRLRARVKNQSASDATAVSLELLHVPSNVTIIDPLVDVGSVAAGATVTSADTFTIRVDRRTLISQLGISWRVTYAIGGATEDRTFAGSLDRETLEPTHLPAEPVPVPKQGTNVDAEDGSAGASPSLRSRTSGGEMD